MVLDVGCFGQGIKKDDSNWPHAILKSRAKEVYGIDLELPDEYKNDSRYKVASAEDFSFPVRFDTIFAGDLIEHVSNPGLFLNCVRKHLQPNGILILTTPNTFNLFNMTEKLTKKEPTTNPDHTFYFNSKVLSKLLEKNGMMTKEVSFLYTLGYKHKESWKKKFLNKVYWLLSKFTDKFVETLVIVASAKDD
ncbi:class I SAM-dependent methyltransferase [Candidatus Kaiserbacteria bacterium]|nr:class I SAM-dependent methyltransferase [Candidatus Kaiserbacteria bacterium]